MRFKAGLPGLTRGELARKSVHIGVGCLALLVPWLSWWQGALICLGAFLMNWRVLPRITHHLMEREEDRRRGYAPGILEYPLSVAALFLLFGSRPPVVAAAWGILAFGDGFATLAGRGLGGPKLAWNRSKTLAGTLAFVGVGGTAAFLLAGWTTALTQDPAVSFRFWMMACFPAALLGALVESFESGIDDNISVPLMSGAFLFALSFMSPALLTQRSDRLLSNFLYGCAVNLIVSGLAWAGRTVKPSGAIVGFVIGVAVYTFGGWQAFAILMLFFILATAATRVGYEQKAAREIAQAEGGRRSARHAVANCGVPAFLAFMAATTPHTDLFLMALVAALATAVFDTVSSEIGQVYGRHPFLITNFRSVPAGTDGAVSMEGTLAGLVAASILAFSALGIGMMGSLGPAGAAVAVAASLIGTTVESYLGAASLGSAGAAISRIDNEAMNFVNTLVGALTALGLGVLVLS